MTRPGLPDHVFPVPTLPEPVELALRRANPWWLDRGLPTLPLHRRHFVAAVRQRLELRLAPIVAVRGPRQVGKSTAHLQLIADLLAEGVAPQRILRVEFDKLPAMLPTANPVLAIADWFEDRILGRHFNDAARAGERAYLFLDEVQNEAAWSEQLKYLVDNASVHVCVTGSSALRIEAGRDSLAGRITTLQVGVLSLTEIAAIRRLGTLAPFLPDHGYDRVGHLGFWQDLASYGRDNAAVRDEAFGHFSRLGGYPLAHNQPDRPWKVVADALVDSVIQRVLRHDVGVDASGHDPVLMEETCRAVFQFAGQAPSLIALQRAVQALRTAPLDLEPLPIYLQALADSLLVQAIKPFAVRLQKHQGGAKWCLTDHALRAAWLQEPIPLDPAELAQHRDLAVLAGHLAESVVGTTLSLISHLDLSWLPARGDEPEVDFLLSVGYQRIPLEVKYRSRIRPQEDTAAMRAFLDNPDNRAQFGILITQTDTDVALDPRIVALPLSSLLLLR